MTSPEEIRERLDRGGSDRKKRLFARVIKMRKAELEKVFGPLTDQEYWILMDIRKAMSHVISWKEVTTKKGYHVTVPDEIHYPPWEEVKKLYDQM